MSPKEKASFICKDKRISCLTNTFLSAPTYYYEKGIYRRVVFLTNPKSISATIDLKIKDSSRKTINTYRLLSPLELIENKAVKSLIKQQIWNNLDLFMRLII